MSQHFLLSAKARTLSVAKVARMTNQEARAVFQAIRWAKNDGEPYCPKCGCTAVYAHKTRPIWSCQACGAQFSLTSGTIFSNRKMPLRDYLTAVALFVNGAKGISALQLSRDIDRSYKACFVLAHKLREAMAAEQADTILSGKVEIDGAYFGGYVRPENRKIDRKDRRLVHNRSGKRRSVVVMRERNGRTLPFVFKSEAKAIPTIRERVAAGSTIYADEAPSWDGLSGFYETKRINHSEAYAVGEVSTNWAESYFSRLRRAEFGVHHCIRKQHLSAYAREMAWREDHRREANGTLFQLVVAATATHPISRQWAGYWQRRR